MPPVVRRAFDETLHPVLRIRDRAEECAVGPRSVRGDQNLESSSLLGDREVEETEIEVLPRGVAQVVESVARSGVVEVDDRDWQVVSPDEIPRAEVAMAHNLARVPQRAQCRRGVEPAEESSRCVELLVAPDDLLAARRYISVDEGEHPPALLVDAHEARSGFEPDLLEVLQESVDEGGVGREGTSDRISDANDAGSDSTALERGLISHVRPALPSHRRPASRCAARRPARGRGSRSREARLRSGSCGPVCRRRRLGCHAGRARDGT